MDLKKALLIGAGTLVAGVIAYQFFGTSEEPVLSGGGGGSGGKTPEQGMIPVILGGSEPGPTYNYNFPESSGGLDLSQLAFLQEPVYDEMYTEEPITSTKKEVVTRSRPQIEVMSPLDAFQMYQERGATIKNRAYAVKGLTQYMASKKEEHSKAMTPRQAFESTNMLDMVNYIRESRSG